MPFAIGVFVGLALFGLYLLKDCFFRVRQGEVGVLVRLGGAVRAPGGAVRLHPPGLHAKWPFDVAQVVSLKEQLVPLAGEKGHEFLLLNDGTVIRVDAVARYRVQREGVERWLFGALHPQQHLVGLYTCLLRNEMANAKVELGHPSDPHDDAGGAFALIRRERQLVNRRISEFVNQSLGGIYGVDFRAVDITDIHPPDELADALNSVMSARAQADELRQRVASESAQRLLAAREGVEIARLKAEAAEAEIGAIAANLARLEEQGALGDYVARRKAEVLSDVRTLFVRDGEVRR